MDHTSKYKVRFTKKKKTLILFKYKTFPQKRVRYSIPFQKKKRKNRFTVQKRSFTDYRKYPVTDFNFRLNS